MAKGKEAQAWVTQAQKELTKGKIKILREYANLAGLYMGPDNGIRVVSVFKDTQNTKEAWAQQQQAMKEQRDEESRMQTTEVENKKYEQITRVLAACQKQVSPMEWQELMQHKVKQHLEGNSASSSSNWEQGQWRELPNTCTSRPPPTSKFLEAFPQGTKAYTPQEEGEKGEKQGESGEEQQEKGDLRGGEEMRGDPTTQEGENIIEGTLGERGTGPRTIPQWTTAMFWEHMRGKSEGERSPPEHKNKKPRGTGINH